MGKMIFLAAIEDELIPLKSCLKQQGALKGVEIEFIESGAGVIDSIIKLSKQIELSPIMGRVILLGSAGIIGKKFVPGELYQASVFRWGSVGLALGQGYLPKSLYSDIPAWVIRGFSHCPEEIPVITTPEITSDEKGAYALEKRYGICLENLEAYGIASLFKSYNLSISAFFSVTNRVGGESHQQYLKYRQLAWANLAKAVRSILERWHDGR